MSDIDSVKEKIIGVLEKIYDPEIGVDVWNLGLIYDIVVEEKRVVIKMGLTTPFCPLANAIAYLVKEGVEKETGLETVVELVFDPPWTPERITEKGRKMLIERYGYDVVEAWLRMYGKR